MPSLKDFKKRIHSISSTEKLTRAMQLIAANKLSKYHHMYLENLELKNLAQHILTKILSVNPNVLKMGQQPDNQIAVLITSDKGLCGGYNANVVKHFKADLAKLTEGDTKLIVIGKKGQRYFKDFENIEFYPNHLADYRALVDELADKMVEAVSNGLCEISIYFNNFKNFVTHDYHEQVCWPIEIEERQDDYILDGVSYIDALRMYFKTSIISALLSSATSELSARMIAMDNASKNAESLIDKLTLQYNRSRQELITKELIEIISGAEAL